MSATKMVSIPGLGTVPTEALRHATPSSIDDNTLQLFWHSYQPLVAPPPRFTGSLAGWPVSLQPMGEALICRELDPSSGAAINGIATAADLYVRQSGICSELGVEPQCPSAFQLVATPPDIDAIDMVAAMRIPSPPHMSGWWIHDAVRSDNDFANYVTSCLHHAISRWPAFGSFIALPPGYRAFPMMNATQFDPDLLRSD